MRSIACSMVVVEQGGKRLSAARIAHRLPLFRRGWRPDSKSTTIQLVDLSDLDALGIGPKVFEAIVGSCLLVK